MSRPLMALIRLDFEPTSLLLSRGDATVFVTQPLGLALPLVSLGLLAVLLPPNIRSKREEAFSE